MTLTAAMRRPWWARPGIWALAGFVAYVATLVLSRPLLPGGPDFGTRGQLLGVGLLLLAVLPFLGSALARLRLGHDRSACVLHLFWIVVLVLTPFARVPAFSLAYLVITVAVYVAAGVLWEAPRAWLRAGFGAIAVVCFGFCLGAVLAYPLGPGRQLGMLTPNHCAAIALTPVLLSFVFPGAVRALIMTISLGFILYVGARGALVAWGLFIAVHESARLWIVGNARPLWRAFVVAGLAVPVACGVLLAWPATREKAGDALAHQLAWRDPARGLGSGFTGRVELWREHREEIAGHFVAGIGFRGARGEAGYGTTHNAYFDLLKETGVIGVLLYLVFAGLRILQLTRVVLGAPRATREREHCAGVLAALVALLFLACFEIWLLNVGFPIGACALLFYGFHEPAPAAAPVPLAARAGREGACLA